MAVAEIEIGGRHHTILPRPEVEDADPREGRGDVGPVATGIHAHAAADGTRHADGPLEPREAGGRGLAGEDRQGGRAAGARRRTLDVDGGEGVTEDEGEP